MRERSRPTRPLHVLLTTDVVGGLWDFCWVLASELIRAGSRVTILAFGTPSPAQARQAGAAGATLVDAPLKLEWMQDSAEDLRAARALTARLARDLRPDVLHVNQYALAHLEAAAPIVLTAHSDVLSWLKWTERGGKDGPVPIEWTRYAALVRQGLRAADVVVGVSDFLAHELRTLYRVGRPIPVIYNGWPPGRGDPRPIAERADFTLLAGRAWDSAKNVQLAVLAARAGRLGRVLLAGDQRHPESGGLREFGRPLEPLGRLSREQLDQHLAEARVYLAPARYEPFGLLPLQAALAGCPLLLSDIPAFRELWDGAALFFRSDDVADLRPRWARLLEDDELAADLARRARRRAVERYTSARMAADYVSVYTELLERRAGRVHGGQTRVRA